MKPTVVITARLPEIAARMLSHEVEVVNHDTDRPRSEDELITLLAEADAAITLLSDPLTRRVLSSNPNLRMIAQYAVGVNNIDLDAARDLGITVTNTPGVLTDATADLTMALLLAVSRRVVEGDAMLRRGEFTGWHPLMLLGHSLRGKQMGIVGMGRIGYAVAARARAFGMSISYTARSRHLDTEEAHESQWMPLDELILTSHVVSLHCPLTEETRDMINAEAIATMRPDTILINTARGPLVDEAALAEALEQKRIAGAGLDVYAREPEVEPRLTKLQNVVLLPHLGSATEETRNEMARIVATDTLAFFRGQKPAHVVVSGIQGE